MNPIELELIQQYIAAYNRFDVDGMCACMHSEIHFENWNGEQLTMELDGLQAFRQQAEAACAYFSAREQIVLNFEIDEDRVLLEISYRATLATTLPNGMRAGDFIQLQGKSLFTFQDGLIRELVDRS